VSQTADPVGYNTDYLLRGERTNANVGDDTRREFTRLLSAAVTNGSLAADDRAYMTRVVATQSGLAPAEADARISTAIAQTKAATDRARKTGVLIGFLTAASLALGAAAAWWGAGVGGRHRDDNFDASHLTRW
jgi:hypothetical protein